MTFLSFAKIGIKFFNFSFACMCFGGEDERINADIGAGNGYEKALNIIFIAHQTVSLSNRSIS